MILSKLIKNPFLAIGLLMLTIILLQQGKDGIFSSRIKKLHSTSCDSALIMLSKRIPKSWDIKCEKNKMKVKIEHPAPPNINIEDLNKEKFFIYRELANDLIFIAKNSPSDSLERTTSVEVLAESKNIIINAIASGNDISKLETIKTNEFIMEHLKRAVQIKEKIKGAN